jgi:hypothetical protein
MIATAMAVMDGVRMTSISEQPKGRA